MKTKTPKRSPFADRLARRDRAAAHNIQSAGLFDLPVLEALETLGYLNQAECARLATALG